MGNSNCPECAGDCKPKFTEIINGSIAKYNHWYNDASQNLTSETLLEFASRVSVCRSEIPVHMKNCAKVKKLDDMFTSSYERLSMILN